VMGNSTPCAKCGGFEVQPEVWWQQSCNHAPPCTPDACCGGHCPPVPAPAPGS
jgi:hypothetical protein